MKYADVIPSVVAAQCMTKTPVIGANIGHINGLLACARFAVRRGVPAYFDADSATGRAGGRYFALRLVLSPRPRHWHADRAGYAAHAGHFIKDGRH